MKFLKIFAAALAASLVFSSAAAGQVPVSDVFHQAKRLYDDNMYLGARELFETVSGDPVTDGYIVLCALYSNSSDAETLAESYQMKYGRSSLSFQIDWKRAVMHFDAGEYSASLKLMDGIKEKKLYEDQREEYRFKRAYCLYEARDYESALTAFGSVETGRYRTASYFYSAMIYYNCKNYSAAEDLFKKCTDDLRFADLSSFYIVDCEFNAKNYHYVVNDGVEAFEAASADRRFHLARLISESYLVIGEKKKAREYYDLTSHFNMSKSDYFYAASVMNSVEDYVGAIENYKNYLNENSNLDSLWQVANYNLAGAYLKTHNLVAAMDAFKFASEVSYDQKMTEDAMFNYAKLSFDLNKDTSGFTKYIKTYSTARRDDIYTYIALAALYDRNYAAAVEAYDNIEYLTPDMRSNYAKANYLRANQLISSGSFSDAVRCLKAAAYYIPKSDMFNQLARYWLAESYYKSENYAFACDIYLDLYNSAALDGHFESALLSYNAAYCFFKQKDYENAAKWFDRYLENTDAKYREDALVRRADCDFARKKYKDAIRGYGVVVAEYNDVNKIYPYFKQAIAYGLSGDKKSKLNTLSSVEKASPSAEYYFEAMNELGDTYLDQKLGYDAIRVFNKLKLAATDDRCKAIAEIGLGMACKNTQNFDEALNCYKNVVRMMPGTDYANDALAAIQSVYQTLGTPELYAAFVEENSNILSQDASKKEQLYFSTAEQIYLAGRFKDAVSSFEKFISEYPSSSHLADSYFYIADCYKNLGDNEKACSYFAKVGENGGGSNKMPALLNYAALSYKLERFNDALDAYGKLRRESADSSQAYYANLGIMRSAYSAKRYDEALQVTRIICDSDLSDETTKREALYIQAKSYMSTSHRKEAIADFSRLAAEAMNTDEGAEAKFILVQDYFDQGEYEKVESSVFDFSDKAGDRYYWLAKAYTVLGDSFVQRGLLDQAKATYESIRDGYEPYGSGDDVLDNVNMRLERLKSE